VRRSGLATPTVRSSAADPNGNPHVWRAEIRFHAMTPYSLIEFLSELLPLLPRLRVVVLFGRKAQQGWERTRPSVDVPVLRAPHPSGRWLNAHPRTVP
jgi:hypothetical protein